MYVFAYIAFYVDLMQNQNRIRLSASSKYVSITSQLLECSPNIWWSGAAYHTMYRNVSLAKLYISSVLKGPVCIFSHCRTLEDRTRCFIIDVRGLEKTDIRKMFVFIYDNWSANALLSPLHYVTLLAMHYNVRISIFLRCTL